MSRKISKRRSACPVSCTLDLVGDRWTLLVVRDLFFGRRYFDELLRSPEGIATNILTARLQFLTDAGLVSRETDEDDRRRVVYTLTARGRELATLLEPIVRWGLKNISGTHVPEGILPPNGHRRANKQG